MRTRPTTMLSAAVLAAVTAFTGLAAASASAAPVTLAAAQSQQAETSCTSAVTKAPKLPQLRQGSKGVHVLTLQAALNHNGATLQGTGTFGPSTKKAVVAFQKKHGIKASGIVGPKTWTALGVRYNPDHFGTFSLKPGATKPPQPTHSGSSPMSGYDKTGYFLMVLNQAFPGWTQNSQLGDSYNGNSVKAVQEFQRRAGIKPSGIIGPQTNAAMNAFLGFDGYAC